MSENSDPSSTVSRAAPGDGSSFSSSRIPSEFLDTQGRASLGGATGGISVDDWTGGGSSRALPPTPPIAPCCQQQSRAASPCQAASSSLIMPSSSPSIPGLPSIGQTGGSGPRLVGFIVGPPNVLGFRPRPPLPFAPLSVPALIG